MPLEKLNEGDILILSFDRKAISRCNTKEKLERALASNAFHGSIYHQTNDKEKNIVHAQTGTYQTGVKKILLDRYTRPTEDPYTKEDSYTKLGDYYILRCKQSDVASKIGEVAARWAPKILPEQYKFLTYDDCKGLILPTPHGHRTSSGRDIAVQHQNAIHLYRALRAYIRNKTPLRTHPIPQEAMPLSKKQGVSCSDFVAYSHKVALIDTLFPTGLPKNVLQLMNDIQQYKDKNAIKKASEIPNEMLLALADSLHKSISEENYQQLIIPVKSMGINFFAQRIIDHPKHWEHKGYLCYVDGEPYIIDHKTFQEITKNGDHSINITREELCCDEAYLATRHNSKKHGKNNNVNPENFFSDHKTASPETHNILSFVELMTAICTEITKAINDADKKAVAIKLIELRAFLDVYDHGNNAEKVAAVERIKHSIADGLNLVGNDPDYQSFRKADLWLKGELNKGNENNGPSTR